MREMRMRLCAQPPGAPGMRDAGARLREMGDVRGVDPALARRRRGLAPVPAS